MFILQFSEDGGTNWKDNQTFTDKGKAYQGYIDCVYDESWYDWRLMFVCTTHKATDLMVTDC